MTKYSELERQIVQAIALHLSRGDETSLTELARECHVAKSTVSRALQKLGYRGMGELTQSLRIEGSGGAHPLLPRSIVAGDVDEAARRLAERLFAARRKKSFIFSADHRYADLLATYMARKLALFEIMAAPSCDYAMTQLHAMEPGLAIFCFHHNLAGVRRARQPEGYGLGMLAEARRAGFEVVALADDPRFGGSLKADLLLSIEGAADPASDFYLSRVLVLFEKALAELSRMLEG